MTVITKVDQLITRARGLTAEASGRRVILGIVGAPGSGKSTLARVIANGFESDAVVVPMDGFHLAQSQLEHLGRADRKGAPDTFDADGFLTLLRRLADRGEEVVYAPMFERSIEEPIAGAIAIARAVPLVIVEGNYLLVDSGPWAQVLPILTESWFLSVGDDERVPRLIERHRRFGRDPVAAREHATGSDQRNAELIAATAHRATLIVELAESIT